MTVSVVVPAHNEAAVIHRLLDQFEPYAGQGLLRLVIACNGCTDDTVAIARRTAPAAIVLDLRTVSKTAALQTADALCGDDFPRFYVDADVVISGEGLMTLARRLDSGDLLAVAPVVRYDTSGASWLVRRHARMFELLEPHGGGIHGTGVMGVTAAGRRRFDTWPDAIADDYFLDGLFDPRERARLPEVEVAVAVSRRLPDLVRRRSRVLRANADIHRRGLRETSPPRVRGIADVVRSRPSRVVDAMVYVGVALLCRVAGWYEGRKGPATFSRDDSRQHLRQDGGV